jgi:hypothetical protein
MQIRYPTFVTMIVAGAFFIRSKVSAKWGFLQGTGGAMVVPVGRLIVLRTTPKT